MQAALVEKDTDLVVKELLETLYERKAGYKQAAEQVEDQGLAEFFLHIAEMAREQIDDLIIFAEGEFKETSGPLGRLFRTWMSFRNSFSGGKPRILLKDCLTGEESAIKIYEGAINADIPENVRQILRRHRKDMLEVSAGIEKKLAAIK